ncbi:MAG: domain S-box protein [Proteobacteria bacterium]|nr:domain S-box protein [Pseudomonadota bacterium]
MSVPPPASSQPGPSASIQGMDLTDTNIRVIRLVLWLFLCLSFPLSLLSNIFSSGALAQRLVTSISCLLIPLATLWFLHRQHFKTALGIFLWGLTTMVCVQCWLVNGIRTPIAIALPAIVMLSAWMSSRRHTFMLCSAILVTLSIMALFEPTLWPNLVPRTPFHYWTVYFVCVVMGGMIAANLATTMHQHQAQQQQTSAELARRVQELQLIQEKFSTFFFLNPVPVSISLLSDGTYYDVNPIWEKLSGWNKAEVIGKTATQLDLWISEAERNAWITGFHERGYARNQLVRFRLRDGHIRYFVCNSETINYEGKPCIFAAFVDVTERRDAEEALKQLNYELEDRVHERTQRLAEANQSLASTVDILQRTQDELIHTETMASLGAMVAGISHELNTPIGNALTVVSSLQEQARDMGMQFADGAITRSALRHFISEQQHGAELASTSLKRASELVASFKQVSVDQASERRRSFDLAETLHGVLDTLRPMLRFKPVELILSLPTGIQMDSYPGPLGQIISNLVQNAVLHGLDARPSGKVWVEASAPNEDTVRIMVRDDGKGISDEHMGRIFDPFFTTRLGQGGSGLGLAIVYRLTTTLLNGTISVDSQLGAGASFTLVLPRKAPESSPRRV